MFQPSSYSINNRPNTVHVRMSNVEPKVYKNSIVKAAENDGQAEFPAYKQCTYVSVCAWERIWGFVCIHFAKTGTMSQLYCITNRWIIQLRRQFIFALVFVRQYIKRPAGKADSAPQFYNSWYAYGSVELSKVELCTNIIRIDKQVETYRHINN